MKAHSATTAAAVVVCILAAGCAQDGTLATNNLNTSSIEQQNAAAHAERTNPECVTLVSQIEALNKDGTADKVSKAALKKYKMKTGDLAKADELNKAHAEFQAKCSNYPPSATVAVATPEATPTPAPTAAAPKVAAKSKPPVPAPKPVASALAPQGPDGLGQSPTQQAQP